MEPVHELPIQRTPGAGWLALIGGGEFSFGETLEADESWLARTAEGPIGFLPTASGSPDYAKHFAEYLDEAFDRRVELIPIYRDRDARRAKNLRRIDAVPAVYIGGGVTDDLLAVLADSPGSEALLQKMRDGGTIVAIAAAAQAFGSVARPLHGHELLPGLGWLRGGVLETNFEPAHDRRLREMMRSPAAQWGLGLPSGAALLLGPDGAMEVVGMAFLLTDADGDYTVLRGPRSEERGTSSES
jgi:cyanophycinase-like exopeptidase